MTRMVTVYGSLVTVYGSLVTVYDSTHIPMYMGPIRYKGTVEMRQCKWAQWSLCMTLYTFGHSV